MSFNILMVPVAIALRVVMGEEGFDKWVRSNERRMQTQIRTDQELERIVTTAGYDLIKYGSFKKTHFGDTFFLWEKEDGCWTAVFSVYDDDSEVRRVVERINNASDRNLFLNMKKMCENKGKLLNKQRKVYPTNFLDEGILRKALAEADIPYVVEKGVFVCRLNGCRMEIYKGNKAYYEVQIEVNDNMNKPLVYLNVLDEEYKKVVQTETYLNIVKKVRASPDMEIEEEYLEGDSMVLVVRCTD